MNWIKLFCCTFCSIFLIACNTENGFTNKTISENTTKVTFDRTTVYIDPIQIFRLESKAIEVKMITSDGSKIALDNLTNTKWSIDDESIARIDTTGSETKLTGLSPGTTELDFTGYIGDDLISAQTTVTVNKTKVTTWWVDGFVYDSDEEQPKFMDIKEIYTSGHSYAAIKYDGSIVTWGEGYAADSSAVQSQLTNVKTIFSTWDAFAALKEDGSVVVWGHDNIGGDSSAIQSQLTNIKEIFSTNHAFAALKEDGAVITWGDPNEGGNSSDVQSQLTDVKTIFSSDRAFVALKNDGSVISWGDIEDFASIQSQLFDIKEVASTNNAFAAINHDDTVVTWGEGYSADSSYVRTELTDVIKIVSTKDAFAALKKDGTVVTWGADEYGGDSSEAELTDIKEIFSNSEAFAALKNDGTVVTWGNPDSGGDSTSVKSQLTNVKDISTSPYIHSFTALKEDGSIVYWPEAGNNTIQEELIHIKNVTKVYATDQAYAALREDGSVIMWDYRKIYDTDSNKLQNVTEIYPGSFFFAFLSIDE